MLNFDEVLSEFREYLRGTENSWRFAEMFTNICEKLQNFPEIEEMKHYLIHNFIRLLSRDRSL